MPTNAVTELIRALSAQAVQVVDLTQPLSESTPVIELPEPYVNSPGLSRRELARYDERNPLARWDALPRRRIPGPPGVLQAAIGASNCDACVRDTLEGFAAGFHARGKIAIRHWASDH